MYIYAKNNKNTAKTVGFSLKIGYRKFIQVPGNAPKRGGCGIFCNGGQVSVGGDALEMGGCTPITNYEGTKFISSYICLIRAIFDNFCFRMNLVSNG